MFQIVISVFFLLIVLLIHARVFYIITYNVTKEALIYPKDIHNKFYEQQMGVINGIWPWNYSRLSWSYDKGRELEYLFIVYIWGVTSSKKKWYVFNYCVVFFSKTQCLFITHCLPGLWNHFTFLNLKLNNKKKILGRGKYVFICKRYFGLLNS
jgi:hypothetical protein